MRDGETDEARERAIPARARPAAYLRNASMIKERCQRRSFPPSEVM